MASPEVIMELFGGLPSQDSSGDALTPIVWKVLSVPVGVSPLEVTGVPKQGSQLTLYGKVFTCDRVGTPERINNNDFTVETWYSTDGRYGFEVLEPNRAFDYTYKKVSIKAPYFVAGKFNRSNPDGTNTLIPWYFRRELEFSLEFPILSIEVEVTAPNDESILAAIATAEAQIGHVHVFPYNPNRKWLMLPFSLRRQNSKLRFNYSWEFDPGNGKIEIPGIDPPGTEYPAVLPPARPSWMAYSENPAPLGATNITPSILLADFFPTTSDKYTPNGWQILPGRPI